MRFVVLYGLLLISFLSSAQKPAGDILVERARQLAKDGHTDSASYYFDEAIAKAKSKYDSSLVSRLLIEKGKVHETAGNFESSIQTYIEALNISKRRHNLSDQGLCYIGLSNANFRVANNEAAWKHGLDAVRCFTSLKDTTHWIESSMLVGQIEISLGKLDEANAIYSNMLAVANRIGDSTLIADNLDHLGVIQSFRKDFRKALILHEQAEAINKKIRNQFNLAINYANLAEVQMRMGNYPKALSLFQNALVIEKKINANSVMIFTHYTLAECYSRMGDATNAIVNFNRSLKLIDQQGEARERPAVFGLLSEHYERNRDFSRSLSYFKKSTTGRDSLQLVASSYAMEELRMIYEADKRESDLRAALLENKLQSSRLRISDRTITKLSVAIGTSIVGLVIATVLAIRLYRNEKKLRLANRTKDALLSIIGHDLRGPMTNISQLVKFINSSEGEDREACIRMLEKPVNAAVHLLDDLLTWSRSARQQSTSVKTDVSVFDVANRSMEVVKEQAAAKQILILVKVRLETMVFADVNHVSSILRNLISNAIKFTPKGGTVTISDQPGDGYVTIRISDTGVGMDAQTIKAILGSRFYSTHGTQNEKGSGFGLMLCQEFIRLNDGTLSIESKLAKGSTISFTLPAAKV